MTLDESIFDPEALVRRDRMTADAIVDALLVRVRAQIEHVHRATPCSTEPCTKPRCTAEWVLEPSDARIHEDRRT